MPHLALRAVFATLILLAGCKDEKKAPAPTPAGNSPVDRVRDATEQNLRAGAPPKMQFRGVQVYTQALPQRMAVCGLLDPFADDPDIFVPFVSIVTVPLNQDDKVPQYQFEHRIGKTTSEASHVYVAIVDNCWEHGGPAPGPYRSVTPTPPLPDNIPDPARGKLTLQPRGQTSAAAAPTGADPATAARAAGQASPLAASPPADQTITPGTPASGIAVMRQAANLHADPHGPAIRVVPQGTAMHVFAQSPGGWYQVGDTAPWGWVHESMLDRHP